MSSMDSLRYYNKFLQTGLMSMDPNTGEVKAWVGGLSHKFFKYDHVHQAKRQPGSTFKVFVYGKAMEDGYAPCDKFYNTSPVIDIDNTSYHPANADGTYGDDKLYTLRQAMAKSYNSVSIQLMDKLKPVNVAEFATRLGITSKLDPVYSLGLGTSDVSLDEMVAAFCSFVNLGINTKPFYLTRIEDKYGNTLENFIPKTSQVMDEATAYKMVYMLQGGVQEEGGTSGTLSKTLIKDNEIGGKTGTTDNASDGWYIGITHNLVTGIWVGGDEPSIHFPSWNFGSGVHTALPMWSKYMQKIYEHSEIGYGKGFFKQPSDSKFNFIKDCQQYSPDPAFQIPD